MNAMNAMKAVNAMSAMNGAMNEAWSGGPNIHRHSSDSFWTDECESPLQQGGFCPFFPTFIGFIDSYRGGRP